MTGEGNGIAYGIYMQAGLLCLCIAARIAVLSWPVTGRGSRVGLLQGRDQDARDAADGHPQGSEGAGPRRW